MTEPKAEHPTYLPPMEPDLSIFDALGDGIDERTDQINAIRAVFHDLEVTFADQFATANTDLWDHSRLEQLSTFDVLEGGPLRDDLPAQAFGPADPLFQPVVTLPEGAVVSWRWETVNIGNFFGLARTNREIRINGSTSVRLVDGEAQLIRFIDWLDVLGQMGVAVAARTIPQ